MPSSIVRSLLLLLFWISHAMADYSKLLHSPTQEDAVTLSSSLLPADVSEISSNPLESSPWTTAESSNNQPRLQQKELPLRWANLLNRPSPLATQLPIVPVTRPTKSSLLADENTLNSASAKTQISAIPSNYCNLNLELTKGHYLRLDPMKGKGPGQHLKTVVKR